MAAIVRGTTPSITFVFKTVTVTNISKAVLRLKQNGTTVVERNEDTMTADGDAKTIKWTLTQEETLSLMPKRDVEVVCDWLLLDGTRGRSRKAEFGTEEPAVNGVIEGVI